MTAFEPLTDFEDSYEIEVEEPHRIRKIGSDTFVNGWIDVRSGYVKLTLNGRLYQLHRILAKHFIRVSNRARYEYLTTAPNDITEIRTFNGVEYADNKYFFCFENDMIVQRYSDHKWRFLSLDLNNGYARINMYDINKHVHHVYFHKIIHHFRHEPAEDQD